MKHLIKKIVSYKKTKKSDSAHKSSDLAKTLTSSPTKAILKEIGLFGGIFVAVFIVSMAFVNANLLYHTAKDFFVGVKAQNFDFSSNAVSSMMKDNQQLTHFIQDTSNDQALTEAKRDRALFVTAKAEQVAQLSSKTYDFSYSLVPPGNRMFISSIGVDAPIVDISAASEAKLKHGDFDEELFQGVVKYPSTPEPGMHGNALIFGHTSYYRWKKNPYGEVFAKVHNLKNGDTIKLAWKGQLYTYEVVAQAIVNPDKVDEEYMKYTDGEYITLMGCYPIGTDTRRSLIFAKRIMPTELKAPTAN